MTNYTFIPRNQQVRYSQIELRADIFEPFTFRDSKSTDGTEIAIVNHIRDITTILGIKRNYSEDKPYISEIFLLTKKDYHAKQIKRNLKACGFKLKR